MRDWIQIFAWGGGPAVLAPFLHLQLMLLRSVLDHRWFQKKQRTRDKKRFSKHARACNMRDVRGHTMRVLRFLGTFEFFEYEDSTRSESGCANCQRGFKCPCGNIWARAALAWAQRTGILVKVMHQGAQEFWAGRAMSLHCDTDPLGARPYSIKSHAIAWLWGIVDPQLISKIGWKGTVPGFLRRSRPPWGTVKGMPKKLRFAVKKLGSII